MNIITMVEVKIIKSKESCIDVSTAEFQVNNLYYHR